MLLDGIRRRLRPLGAALTAVALLALSAVALVLGFVLSAALLLAGWFGRATRREGAEPAGRVIDLGRADYREV